MHRGRNLWAAGVLAAMTVMTTVAGCGAATPERDAGRPLTPVSDSLSPGSGSPPRRDVLAPDELPRDVLPGDELPRDVLPGDEPPADPGAGSGARPRGRRAGDGNRRTGSKDGWGADPPGWTGSPRRGVDARTGDPALMPSQPSPTVTGNAQPPPSAKPKRPKKPKKTTPATGPTAPTDQTAADPPADAGQTESCGGSACR
ncbi:Transient receptor potential protein [Actinoplanes sp. SE50]|uniref:hypothetical protein n=1 Tax=unclassified Actinoplanes TaxID=2626549 RepID=UPI00023EC4E5|nr:MULTISPECIES: hypothetical protein [unclassified Actinoplanes]AEV86415.1 Transient receptor potential protein [Actinoplanes sp. SE50/110]ATO84812.1 Transient receptor potential protein [Actinoplanes sp. SE50]SLM02222.1 hypothetical protein ACSP50_5460 [Actinoplanes sp. SE50/110]